MQSLNCTGVLFESCVHLNQQAEDRHSRRSRAQSSAESFSTEKTMTRCNALLYVITWITTEITVKLVGTTYFPSASKFPSSNLIIEPK